MIKYKVTLTKEERAESEEISSKELNQSIDVLILIIVMRANSN